MNTLGQLLNSVMLKLAGLSERDKRALGALVVAAALLWAWGVVVLNQKASAAALKSSQAFEQLVWMQQNQQAFSQAPNSADTLQSSAAARGVSLEVTQGNPMSLEASHKDAKTLMDWFASQQYLHSQVVSLEVVRSDTQSTLKAQINN